MAKRRGDDEPEGASEDGTPSSVGLSVIRAAEVPLAVIFRRGPTKQVRMIRWDMRTDDFQRGQWLAGRVYPMRCDVSADGKYVIYAGMRRGDEWRAIAKLPYFTPLAVWDGPNAGGWASTTDLALPSWVVATWPPHRANRDGWAPAGEEAAPFRDTKPHATLPALSLQRRDATPVMDGYASWTDRHSHVFQLFDHRSDVFYDLGTADWADWHPSGDVAIARDGAITRIPIVKRAPGTHRVIADFSGETFERIKPPADATRW